MTLQEINEKCRIWKHPPITQKQIKYALENNTTIPIDPVGCWNPKTKELHSWIITPSSEDKGYCGP